MVSYSSSANSIKGIPIEELALIFVEAGLELVPSSIRNHPSVRKSAIRRGKKPSEIILDISLHYQAMKRLPNFKKRGRPDILHVCLLEALSSPLNLEGKLRTIVHTIGDKIIYLDPSVRIPRNYNRFLGLFEQLLIRGRVPPGKDKPLIWMKRKSLAEIVREISPTKVILMDEHGKQMNIHRFAEEIVHEDIPLIMIGAFQSGDFEESTKELADISVSIYPNPLAAWVVTSRILCGIEEVLGII
ncbi:MAG: 16S rRNA methyltransferase [Thermoprotei archaeon]|nr:MAG: 16S rRNA methyltransferase [Thermoprotei archaeon]